jgi:hypothetical protein
MALTSIFTKVHGTRFTDKYLQARQQFSRSTYSYAPSLPPRSPAKAPSSPKAAAPGSPPRKVVTDFAAFGAPANASVFGTAVASTPFSLAGGKAAFGGIRGGGGRGTFDEDDDDEDGGRQRVELREGSISLDQVREFPYVSSTPLTRCVDRPGASPCRVHGAAHILNMSPLHIISLVQSLHNLRTILTWLW